MADLVAGAPLEDRAGAVWILFMNADGAVKSQQKIPGASGKLKDPLSDGDGYGRS